MSHESNPNRSRRPSSARNKASQFDASAARGQGSVAEESEGGRENILDGRRNRRIHYKPESGKVNWCEFTFDVAHPHDDKITLRFIIEAPVPLAREFPRGSMLETRIRWREEISRGR